MQCRGFTFGQTGGCTCPKSQMCSRNQTQLCVQLNANNCRLYGNECDLEADRCRGQSKWLIIVYAQLPLIFCFWLFEGLLDVDNLHCQRFRVGVNGTCTCARLLTCQQNVTNICVINSSRRCQLMRNQCDLERGRCQGSGIKLKAQQKHLKQNAYVDGIFHITVFNRTQSVQCRSLNPGDIGNCACPALISCSMNRTNICVRTRIGCRLKRNECELEQSRCMGEGNVLHYL